MKHFIKILRENIFPNNVTCDICGTETFNGNLCAECLKTITFNNGTVCPVCGRKTVRPEICLECKAKPPLYKKAVSPIVYENGGTIIVQKFKNGNAYLKDYFASLIAEKLKDLPELDCIVYVPSNKAAIRKRGYNQAELLANSISKQIHIPVIKNAVIKTTPTAEQKKLTRKERAENLKRSFKVANRDEVKGKRVLVVDDILTTGATADEMAKKLLSAGTETVYFASVASVEYKQNKE